MIWNKSELTKIKQIILNKTNFSLDKNSQLILDNSNANQNDIDYNFTKSKSSNYVFGMAKDEIYKLFYVQNREEIINILNKLSNIEFDKNNLLHLGLISCLSKINTADHTYVFVILREIISQFERVISDVINKTMKNITCSDDILVKIAQIENSSEDTYEEIKIKNTMNAILGYAPGLREIDVYNSLIEKEFANIRNRILVELKYFYSDKRHKEEEARKIDCLHHKMEFGRKYQHKKDYQKLKIKV